ncbi:MAG: hypothetical protein JWM20_878 [Patescibacteria group bacterium]|nr:hypothetical protein [Patescibacteria group bacterium]
MLRLLKFNLFERSLKCCGDRWKINKNPSTTDGFGGAILVIISFRSARSVGVPPASVNIKAELVDVSVRGTEHLRDPSRIIFV